MASRPCLDDFPDEIIDHICIYLDGKSIIAFRQLNKHIQRASGFQFGRRCFRKRGFLITPASIAALRSIASHHALRGHLEHLWFDPDFSICYQTVTRWLELEARSCRVPRSKSMAAALIEQVKRCTTEHRELLFTNELRRELTSIFLQLPNLKVLGIRRGESYKPWGWRTLRNTLGQDPRITDTHSFSDQNERLDNMRKPTRLFVVIMEALAATVRQQNRQPSRKSGMCSPIRLQRLYSDSTLVDEFKSESLLDCDLTLALQYVQSLEVNFVFGVDGLSRESNQLENLGLMLFKRILRAMPNLKESAIQQLPWCPYGTFSQMVIVIERNMSDHLHPVATFSDLAGDNLLQNLTKVELEGFFLHSKDLIRFIQSSGSKLQSLKLRKMRLFYRSDMPGWKGFFSLLHSRCTSLAYLHLSELKRSHILGCWKILSFATLRPGKNLHLVSDTEIIFQGSETVKRNLPRLLTQAETVDPINLEFTQSDDTLWYTDTSDEEEE